MSIELVLLIVSALLFISILMSKISDWIGVPALLLFLTLGMLAGSDGIGGIYFDNAVIAQNIGIIALALILFSGGLDTSLRDVRLVVKESLTLALLGTLLTAVIVGAAAYYILGFTLLEGMLVGAIISSTDAAAVFAILRSRGVRLKGRLKPLLELESGSNDPMAVFLTIGLIQLITQPERSFLTLIPTFFAQMLIGGVIGYVMGRVSIFLINRIRLGFDGLYPVFTLTLGLLTFGLAASLGGSGFLAIYLAGLILGNGEFIHRRSMLRFFDGLAWLMQITMFLTLGLFVFPSQLPGVAGPSLLVAAVLMFIARPAAVFVSLLFYKVSLAEKIFTAWVGLRGAAPIILATFPLVAGVFNADAIFNLVFFVVLASVLLQGPSIPFVARLLNVDAPPETERLLPIETTLSGELQSQLREITVPPGSFMTDKRIVDLGLPAEFLVVLIRRDEDFIIPSGGTEIQAGDTLFVISSQDAFQEVLSRMEIVPVRQNR